MRPRRARTPAPPRSTVPPADVLSLVDASLLAPVSQWTGRRRLYAAPMAPGARETAAVSFVIPLAQTVVLTADVALGRHHHLLRALVEPIGTPIFLVAQQAVDAAHPDEVLAVE